MGLWQGIVTGGIAALLGAFLLARATDPAGRVFAAVALSSGAYVISLAFLLVTHRMAFSPAVIATGALVLGSALSFALVFRRSARPRDFLLLLPLLAVIALSPTSAFVSGAYVDPATGAFLPVHGPLAVPLAALVVAYCVLTVALLFHATRRARNLARAQARAISAAFALLLGSILACNVILPLLGFPALNRATAASLLGFLGFVTYALHVGGLASLQFRASEQRLVADIAHGLLTPLAVLRVELEGDLALPDEARTRMFRAIDELSGRVRGLIAYARAGVPLPGTRTARVALDLLAADLAEYVRTVAEDRGIALRVAIEPVSVLGRKDDLETMLTNVVGNALEHAARGAGLHEVFISLARSAEGACLTVGDTGPGMPEGVRERAFEPLYREPGYRTGQGMGLGLAIARQVAEAHGGSIALGSRAGGGTLVEILLPAAGNELIS